MSHLLAISIGPVQQFIAAARRTGDLAAGSQLLVELARAAAAAVEDSGARLIFPADPTTDGPNKIVAEVDGDPAEVARSAEDRVRRYLRRAWTEAFAALRERNIELDAGLAEQQIDTFLEFYAGWWPLEDDYCAARRQLERLLAGRKALRDFPPSPALPGRPKSPLDPSRDCVLAMEGFRVRSIGCEPLWLKPRETLDAISLVKRFRAALGGHVPSTSLMAVRGLLPRLEAAGGDGSQALERLRAIAKQSHGRLDLGDLFFLERLEAGDLPEGITEAEVTELRRKALLAAGKQEPPVYYAILVADGDRMGWLIDGLSRDQQRALSKALSGFAKKAREIVERHHGYLVYSGGDDVLALLPTNRAIACADELAATFSDQVSRFGHQGEGTLSVGVAVVHYIEPLQSSIDRARAAERVAKKKRNALAVAYHPRSGTSLTAVHAWSRRPPPRELWDTWIEAFRGRLARGLPYELQRLASEWPAEAPPSSLRAEAVRILRRKTGDETAEAPPLPDWVNDAASLDEFAKFLTIARFLAGLDGGDG